MEVAAAAAAVAGADGDPVGHRAWWPPTFVAGVRWGIRAAAQAVVQAADRNTRGNTWAVHRPACTVVRPAAFCGGKVCGGTASCGCDGSNRADGVARRDRRTGSAAPAGSGPAPGAAAVAAGTGGSLKPAATGSRTG